MERNPNHPVTREMHDQWHKIALLLMMQMGETKVMIPAGLLTKMAEENEGGAVTIRFSDDGIHLEIVDAAEADRLAHFEGGLPA